MWAVSRLNLRGLAVHPSNLLAPYQNFRPPEDLATAVMTALLGGSFTSPLTVGLTSNSLLGGIFLVFNVIVFAIGTIFTSYGISSGIVQTAHEGVVLGKRLSAVLMPIRMVTGIVVWRRFLAASRSRMSPCCWQPLWGFPLRTLPMMRR